MKGQTATQVGDALDAVIAGEPIAWDRMGLSSEALLARCDADEIGPLVHHQLRRFRSDIGWPPAVRARLERDAAAAAALEIVRRREIDAVLGALAAADIQPILLKGVPLAYGVYDEPSLRPYADVDALIRRGDVDRVKSAMRGVGYTETRLSGEELLFCQFEMTRRDALGVLHVFDFHWKISTQSLFADVLTYDELQQDAEPIAALGPSARCASAVHALLLACVHPSMHHRNVDRRIWLYDVHLLLGRLDAAAFDRFAGLAVQRRVAAVSARQLARSAERFHSRIPQPIASKLSGIRGEPSAAYLEPGRRWHHELIDNLRGRGWRERAHLLREVLLPPRRYMVEAPESARHGARALPLLYLHRLALGGWKIVTGRK